MAPVSGLLRGFALLIVGDDGQRDLSWDGELYSDLEVAQANLAEAEKRGYAAEIAALILIPVGVPLGTTITADLSVQLGGVPPAATETAGAPPVARCLDCALLTWPPLLPGQPCPSCRQPLTEPPPGR